MKEAGSFWNESETVMGAKIIPGGRIEGTRTTVYHVLDYSKDDWTPEQIAERLPITVEQVQAALQYIEENKEHVMVQYQKMLDRCARGNPEVDERIRKRKEVMQKWFELERELAENRSGCQH